MKLRTRLFVCFSLLYIFVFTSSFFLENHLVDQSLIDNENVLKARAEAYNKEKISHIETFISDVLLKYVSNINSLLAVIKKTPILRYNFDAASLGSESKTWLDSATLITNNKWIDLVQSKKNEKVASTLFLPQKPCQKAALKKLSEHVFLLDTKNEKEKIYGVKWNFPALLSASYDIKKLSLPNEELSDFYILFSEKQIRALDVESAKSKDLVLSINPWYPFLKWIEVPEKTTLFDSLFSEMLAVKKEIKQPSFLPYDQNREKDLSSYRVDETTNRYDQIGMVWGLSTLVALGPFGEDPFDSRAPLGALRTPKNSLVGEVLYKEEVFRQDARLNKSEYKKNENIELSPQLLFFEEDQEDCAFGNTLYLFDDKNFSELSVGIRAEKIFKEIALGIHRGLFFVAKGKILKAVNNQGEIDKKFLDHDVDLQKLLSMDQGDISLSDQDFVFLHVRPFGDRDFHFFVLSPKKEERFFIDEITKNAQNILKKVQFQMLLVGLASVCLVLGLLDWIAARIARPVSILAEGAKHVEKGELDKVQLISPNKVRKDEIGELFTAFSEMVQGLKEKEKMRGILNKVVSKEIAAEILKTNLDLGGEEKEVTVFFADIRHFTKMTEHMSPKEVILLINRCMSIVTEVVEKFHGVVDKYVGDEIMALFGAPLEVSDSSYLATACALEVIANLNKWNSERKGQGLEPVTMGVGIHSGKVLAGNIGGKDRVNYTVVGSNVNMAARLCGLAMENEILVSSIVASNEKVKREVVIEALQPALLKGFSEKVDLYKVVSFKPIENE